MADSFWKQVNNVIDDSDIVLLVLDARMVKDTRNKEIEDKVKERKKSIIYVIIKFDLADDSVKFRYKNRLKPVVFVSSKEYTGVSELKERILIISHYHEDFLFTERSGLCSQYCQ